MLRESDELHSISQVLRGELSGTLRIGCFTTLSPWLLPRIIAHFAHRLPGVRVEVLETSSDGLQQRLQDGDLDVCLMCAQHIRTRLDHEEIVPVQLVLPAEHQLADRDEVAFRELGDEPAVLLAVRPARDLVEEILRKTGFTPNVAWRIANVETIRSMVGRGLGYSVLMAGPCPTTPWCSATARQRSDGEGPCARRLLPSRVRRGRASRAVTASGTRNSLS
ncbi:LysR substrate-binding domain-containing protein [Prauserella sp. PE36]|uniref:LysR substrate-binding domain-containing protein n=1 Tax=Prauserella sp. PE36 TaxID=1504709 RepID=UPI001313DBDA|nr:LysR substrate-binding domain-containing protein [Prauserella sp. PE36]